MNPAQGFLCKTAFLELAKSLLESAKNDERFDIEEAREALARAPLHDAILNTYGQLIGELLGRATQELLWDNVDTDVLLLEEYLQIALAQYAYPYVQPWRPETVDDFPIYAFEGMAVYSEEDPHRQGLEFIRHFMRAALYFQQYNHRKNFKACYLFHGLDDVVGQFQYSGGHPVLRALVMRNSALVERLLEYFDYQWHRQLPEADQLSASFGKFYRALVPIISEGLWKPSTPGHCEQLWLAHAPLIDSIRNVEAVPWAPGLVAKLTHDSKSPLHRSLHHLLQKEQLNSKHIAEFFPLPLVDCSAKDVLPLLVQLASRSQGLEEGMHFGQAFLSQMQEHHPRIAALLTMHLMVFPDTEKAHEHAQLLLAAFEDARGHTSGVAFSEAIDNIGANVFEYEDVYSPIGLPTG